MIPRIKKVDVGKIVLEGNPLINTDDIFVTQQDFKLVIPPPREEIIVNQYGAVCMSLDTLKILVGGVSEIAKEAIKKCKTSSSF